MSIILLFVSGPVNQVNISPGDLVTRGPYWSKGFEDGEPGKTL